MFCETFIQTKLYRELLFYHLASSCLYSGGWLGQNYVYHTAIPAFKPECCHYLLGLYSVPRTENVSHGQCVATTGQSQRKKECVTMASLWPPQNSHRGRKDVCPPTADSKTSSGLTTVEAQWLARQLSLVCLMKRLSGAVLLMAQEHVSLTLSDLAVHTRL